MQAPANILVLIESSRKLSLHQKQTIALACQLSQEKVLLGVMGNSNESLLNEMQNLPVEVICLVEHELLEHYNAESYCLLGQLLIEHYTPDLVMMPHTYQTRDFSPKLAARFQCSIIADCTGYHWENKQLILERQLFQGRLQADISASEQSPAFITLQAGCFSSDWNKKITTAVQIQRLEIELSTELLSSTSEVAYRALTNSIDYSKAEIIVAIGRGIKSLEHITMIDKLAHLLGGEVAASRPVCDEKWLPSERQIGSSGQSVSPRIYIAIGISGAIQHIIGMRSSKMIVAINQDKNAPIFQIADIGIVGDLFEIVPALIKRLEAEKSSGE